MSKIIWTELISRHYNNFLVGHFSIDRTREFIGRKYYWPSLKKYVKAYIKGCNVCLLSKAVRHKLYNDLQALLVPTHQWKNFTKMVHYKLVKVTINISGLAKVIFDMVVWHYDLLDSIVSNRGSLFTFKFWSLLCYFFSRTAPWRPIFGPLSTSSRLISLDS